MRLASLLLFATALFPVQAAAQDTLNRVLERLRVRDTGHFSYTETRHLQLLAEPWQAAGDIYASQQQMVIAQQSPTFVVTVISADRMLHIDKERDIHRSLNLERPFAVPGMEPFMRLLYGANGHGELAQEYTVVFDTTESRWLLQLAPRQHTEHAVIRMQISGDVGRGPDRMVLQTADGDRTEWQLSLLSQGAVADRELQHALGRVSAR